MNIDQGRLNYATGIDNSQMRSDAAESRNILHSIGSSAVQEGEKIDNTMKNIGKKIAAAFTVQQLTSFASTVVQVRSQIQSLEVSFTTLLGSQTKAKQLFGEIQQFAVKTPMQLDDLAKGAQTLLSFNMAADKVMPTLRALGDVSMGDAQKFQSLVLAFAQIQSTGKLMGQDLLQLINAGFNPLSVISEKTGKSIGVLKEEMSKGEISAQMVEDAFISATSEGGKFYGMLESQSKTLTGSLSNLEGAWSDMLNDIGTKTEGVMADAISLATTCVQHYETFVKVLMSLVAAYGFYKAALMAVFVIEQARNLADNIRLVMMFRKELGLLTAAQQAFNVTAMKNPYILLAAVIVGAITALVAFGKQEDETQKQIDKANEKLKEQQAEMERLEEKKDAVAEAEKSAADSTAEEISKIEILSNTIHDNTASLEDRRRAIVQLQGIVPQYHAELDDEGRLHRDNTTAIEEHIKSLNRLAMARALQSKRQEYASQKVNAEIDRRTATKEEKTATDNLKKANENVNLKKEAYNQRRQELDDATIESDNWLVSGAFSSDEGQISSTGALHEYRRAMEAAEKNAELAEVNLKVAQGKVENADKRIQNANEQLAVLDDMLKDYQDVNVTTTPTTTTTESDKNKKAPKDSTLLQNEYDTSVKIQVRKEALDLEQERINGMNEGVDKYIAQAKVNYERMKLANEEREADMVQALREKRQQEWENANPNAAEQERDAYALDLQTSVTAADLTDEQKNIIKEYARIAKDYMQKANKESLDVMLADVLTYEQARLRITEEYIEKRNTLYKKDENGEVVKDENGNAVLRDGVTQGNMDELNRQEQEALRAVDEQFAQRENTYQAWCEEIANLSLVQLNAVLEQAKKNLEELEKDGSADPKQLAQARAKVNTAQAAVNKANARNQTNPGKRTIKEWEDLYETLNDVGKEFESIGDTVGGVVGDIISECGRMASSTISMINGIVQLTQMSAAGIQGTATAGAKAISTMEKASVILTIISAAMQIAMQIVNLFNNDDEKQKEIEHLQERIDQLQWELDHADIIRLQENSGKAIDRVRRTLAETYQELLRNKIAVKDYAGAWTMVFGKVRNNAELIEKTAQKLAMAYANIAYTADKALGAEKYKQANEQLKNIAQQQILIHDQIRAEEDKKKTDHGAIQEWENKIEELGHQALQIINEMTEDIIGDSSTGIANELGNAFIEAFQAGEDAAEAWGDKVNEIVADVLKRMLIQKALEEPLGEIFDKYKKKWFPDGQFAGLDTVINSMQDFATDLNGARENFETVFNQLPDELKELFISDAEREASQKGIATASQESVDELNGRMTAVQSHTFSISENTKTILSTTQAILMSVMNIENETSGFGARLERMESNIKDMASTVDDIATKGIRLKN